MTKRRRRAINRSTRAHVHTHAYTLIHAPEDQVADQTISASLPHGPGGRRAGPFLALAEKYFLGWTSAGKRGGEKERMDESRKHRTHLPRLPRAGPSSLTCGFSQLWVWTQAKSRSRLCPLLASHLTAWVCSVAEGERGRLFLKPPGQCRACQWCP